MKSISGKSVVNDNAVALWILTHSRSVANEYYIVREFDSNDKMRSFYDSVEISKDKFTINRIKIALCKHKETKDVISSSGKYKYEVCVNCNRGIYESLLTKKEKKLHEVSTKIKFSEFEIENLKESIVKMKKDIKYVEGKISKENDYLKSLKELHAEIDGESEK